MGMGTSIFITAGILLGQVVGLRYADAMIFRQNPNFSRAAKLRYDVTVSSWGERSTGPSCCPLHVSQHSCSWSRCPGSPRVHVTFSLIAEKWRNLKKVECQRWPVLLLIEPIVLKSCWLFLSSEKTWPQGFGGSSMWCSFFILLMWEESDYIQQISRKKNNKQTLDLRCDQMWRLSCVDNTLKNQSASCALL